MTTQYQDRSQEQTGNYSQGRGTIPLPSIVETAANPQGPAYRSFVNSELYYEHRPESTNPCETKLLSICILAFTEGCKYFNNNNFTYGGYCPYHNLMLFKRVFLSMTIGGIHRALPFSTERQIAAPSMFLTSTMKIGMTISEVELLMKNVSASHQEKAPIVKFYSLLSQPYSAFSSDREASIFKTYVNEIKLGYYDLLNNYHHVIKALNVLCTFSKDQADQLMNNEWFRIAKAQFPQRNTTEPDRYVMSIPITYFNIIDMVTILSYYIDPSINQVGYAANCEIAWGRFIHGSGQGIYNSIDQYNPPSDDVKFADQPKEIREALAGAGIRNVANLDVMILSAVPNSKENIPDMVRMSISKVKSPANVFDINKVTIKPFRAA